MKAIIGILKADNTWESREVETDGSNLIQAAELAKMKVRQELGMFKTGHLPEGIVAVTVISVTCEGMGNA